MGDVIKGWCGLCIIISIFYFIFSNNIKSASNDINLCDVILLNTNTTIDTKEDISEKEKLLDEMSNVIRKSYDIDIKKSIYSILKSNFDETKLQKKEFEIGIKGVSGYALVFINKNGIKCTITFIVADRVFTKLRGASVLSVKYSGEKISNYDAVNIAYFVYGLSTDVCQDLEILYSRMLPPDR